jgi:hypothetical protein
VSASEAIFDGGLPAAVLLDATGPVLAAVGLPAAVLDANLGCQFEASCGTGAPGFAADASSTAFTVP